MRSMQAILVFLALLLSIPTAYSAQDNSSEYTCSTYFQLPELDRPAEEGKIFDALNTIFTNFPVEVAKAHYERGLSEGKENSYEASLETYVKSLKSSEQAKAIVDDRFRTLGLQGLMEEICKHPDTKIQSFAKTLIIVVSAKE